MTPALGPMLSLAGTAETMTDDAGTPPWLRLAVLLVCPECDDDDELMLNVLRCHLTY